MKIPLSLLLGLLGAAAAAPLRQGEFTRVINDVKILPVESSPLTAKPGDRISGRTAVSTGAQSRAELRFSDNTLTRLGANSVFRMDHSTRTVEVEKGVILLQVPKQIGGAKVRTAAVTAAITGTTVLLEFTPDGFVKIIVVEGEVDVSLNERRNQFRTLAAGDMWISRTQDKTGLPLPVQVDLERLKKTSKLLSDKEFPPLGNQKQMKGALEDQARKKADGELIDTAFVIEGRGRDVTFFDADRQHLPFETEPQRAQVVAVDAPVEQPRAPRATKPVNIAGTTVFDNRSSIDSSNAFNTATGGFTSLPSTIYLPGEDGPFGEYMYDTPGAFSGLDALLAENENWFVLKGDEFNITGSPSVGAASGIGNLILGATGDLNFTASPTVDAPGAASGNLWALDANLSNLVFTSLSGSINFDGFNLTGTDQNVVFQTDGPESDINLVGSPEASIILPSGSFEALAGRDVSVSATSVEAKIIRMSAERDLQLDRGAKLAASDAIGALAGRDIDVSASSIEAKNVEISAGRNLKLDRGTKLAASDSLTLRAKGGVTITNSSELRRLSQLDQPRLLIEAGDGSADLIDCSSVDMDAVDITSQRGDVRIMNSTIAAREIKARVYDSGGTLLVSDAVLGRGANAADLIRLYGEGANGVRFQGDTTLRGNLVQIAGSKVSIDRGSRVRLSNPAGTTIFSDSHQYNNGVNGKFTGLKNYHPAHVNKQSFGSRPGY
ncbi:MAG: FecR family protein [Luteolibacter sp.]